MSVVCDLVSGATSGLQGSGGGVLGNLINGLGAIASADVAIRLGSGGQAGVLDLPEIFTEERGIECYSPELGDSIWVSPLQWYANGMSCSGLRDPNREAIQQRIEELERRIQERSRVRFRYPDIPSDLFRNLPSELLEELGENSSSSGGDNIRFLHFGYLKYQIDFSQLYAFSGAIFRWQSSVFTYQIAPGDEIRREVFSQSPTGFLNLGTFDENGAIWLNQLVLYAAALTAGSALISGYNADRFTMRGFLPSGEVWTKILYGSRIGSSNPQFISNIPPPPPPVILPFPINIPPQFEIEINCDMGCSCNQIAQILRQQRQTNANIDRLIQEIHRATAASLFVSSLPYKPEERIEQIGKQLYSANPGRGGSFKAANLLDAVAGLIAANYHRSGLHKFPANVPKNLIPEPNQVAEAIDRDFIDLHTLMDFLEWQTKIDDERLGEWPIKFEVIDDGKEKVVPLYNVAEALGDIYGALIKVVEDSDIGVQWGIRSAIEASKAGNAALKAHHLIKELVQFSGALTGPGFIKVDCTFTPSVVQAGTQEDMLKPSEQDIEVTEIVDRRSLLGLLLNISYWSQISGKAVFGDLSNNPATGRPNMPGDGIKEMRKRSRVFNKRWDEWRRKRQQRRNIPIGDQPPGGMNPPDIKDIPQGS